MSSTNLYYLVIFRAASKLPLNMLSTLNTRPVKQSRLIKLHAIPAPFQSIYPRTPKQSYSPFVSTPTLSSDQLRFDRSLLPKSNGQYQPLISGRPLLDCHQVGPIRLVSIGSVLFPPQESIYSVIKRSPNLMLCREIVDSAHMSQQLSNPNQTYTMFAPSDSAIRKRFSPRQLRSMVRDSHACREFVDQHLIAQEAVYTNSIPLSEEERFNPLFGGQTTSVNSCSNEQVRIRRTPRELFKFCLNKSNL